MTLDKYLSQASKQMPEWNLVVKFPIKKCIFGLCLILMITALQTGCSELRQATLDRDFLTKRPANPSWAEDPLDSADQYIADANQVLEAEKPQDEARIVGVSDKAIDASEKQIKLVANPAARSSATAQTSGAEPADSACDHLDQCDCYKRQLKPKLPHAEPIEPPPLAEIPTRVANLLPEKPIQTPPTAIVSQPLAPIILKSQPRAVEVKADSEKNPNFLRTDEPWSSEKPVRIEDRPVTDSQPVNPLATIESVPNPVRQTKVEQRVSQQMRTTDWRDSNATEVVDSEVQTQPGFDACLSATCRSLTCKGCGDNECGERERENVSPVVDPEPVCIVSTISADTVPPFADCPPEDSIKGVVELETKRSDNSLSQPGQIVAAEVEVIMEAETQIETEAEINADSIDDVDDLDDQQWAEVWGPTQWNAPADASSNPATALAESGCSACPDGKCLDLDCERLAPESEIAAVNQLPTPTLPNVKPRPFPANEDTLEALSVESQPDNPNNTFPLPAKPIEVTTPTETNNDFAPATHMAEIPNYETTERRFPPFVRKSTAGIATSVEPSTTDQSAGTQETDHKPDSANSEPAVPSDQPSVPSDQPSVPSERRSALNSFFPPSKVDPQTTIKLPMPTPPTANKTVHVPDAGSHLLIRDMSPNPASDGGPSAEIESNVMITTTPNLQIVDEESEESVVEVHPELEVNVRLLEMLERQMAGLEERQQPLSDSEKQFWQQQMDAIGKALEDINGTANSARLSAAKDSLAGLGDSLRRLESRADLKVINGAFCTEISGFGQFKEFSSTHFRARQRLLVYCEVENYTSSEQNGEFHTTLRGSYRIRDGQGRAVQQAQFATVEDVSGSRRHDFYMYFPIQLTDLPTGEYTLELDVEDTLGNKTASLDSGLAFQVK